VRSDPLEEEKMRRFLFKIIILLLVIGGLYILSEVFLPDLIGRKISKIIKGKEGVKSSVETKVSSHPALKIALGRLDKVSIKIKELNTAGLKLKDVKTKLKAVSFDLPDYLRHQKIRVKSIKASDLEIKISESDLNEYLQRGKDFRDFKARLVPGKVILKGEVEVLGAPLDVSLEGDFVIEEESRMRFVGRKLRVSGRKLPDFITRQVIEKTNPVVDFSFLDLPLSLKRVIIGEGYIKLLGTIEAEEK